MSIWLSPVQPHLQVEQQYLVPVNYKSSPRLLRLIMLFHINLGPTVNYHDCWSWFSSTTDNILISQLKPSGAPSLRFA